MDEEKIAEGLQYAVQEKTIVALEDRCRNIQKEWDKWVLINKGWIVERAALLATCKAVLQQCKEIPGDDDIQGEPWISKELGDTLRKAIKLAEGKE